MIHRTSGLDLGAVGMVVLGATVVAYLAAAITENRRGARHWPADRTLLWMLGSALNALTLVGPLAQRSHTDVGAHMATHLIAGMGAPLFLVLAAPVTLMLRTLDVVPARRLSRVLRSAPVRLMGHPVFALILNLGSLWLVYTTALSRVMLQNELLHYLLLAHFVIVGYLFTASVIGIDPAPHRAPFGLRLAVVTVSIAAHAILAKYIYSHPPIGTTVREAEHAGTLMYYGGDLIEIALLVVLFWQRLSVGVVRISAPRAMRRLG